MKSARPPEGKTSAVGHGDSKSPVRHPLSFAFGDMPADEFDALVADIRRNGLINTITAAEDGTILDGWHRYRACIAAGVTPRIEPFSFMVEPANEDADRKMTEVEFACAQNAHRRHLSASQKREVIAAILKTDPAKSDRAIGGMAKADHKTVAAVRSQAEGSGEIPQTSERKYSDGRTLTKITKPPSATKVAADPSPDSEVAGSLSVKAATARGSIWMDVGTEKVMERSNAVFAAGARAARQAAAAVKMRRVKRALLQRTRNKLHVAIKMLDQLLAGAEVTS